MSANTPASGTTASTTEDEIPATVGGNTPIDAATDPAAAYTPISATSYLVDPPNAVPPPPTIIMYEHRFHISRLTAADEGVWRAINEDWAAHLGMPNQVERNIARIRDTQALFRQVCHRVGARIHSTVWNVDMFAPVDVTWWAPADHVS